MSEVEIALGRPAITPEVRAWINNRPGPGRPVLTRGARSGQAHGAVILRVALQSDSPAELSDELDSLLTDLRMLGLRPTLIPGQLV